MDFEKRDNTWMYKKPNTKFLEALEQLKRIQKGEELDNDTLWRDIDFQADDGEVPVDELKKRIAVLGELIMHNIANGSKLSTKEMAILCEMKWKQLEKEQENE